MHHRTFEDFARALLTAESGISEERYRSGKLSESQIKARIGTENWEKVKTGELSWHDAQYKAVNELGFVGYQFGEALLIDLGYYRDSSYYGGPGHPATNTWDGKWTLKGGIGSLKQLETPLQEGVILDEFARDLTVLQKGLKAHGTSLDELIGETRTFHTEHGKVSVEVTLSGLLAGAHRRGPEALLNLLFDKDGHLSESSAAALKYLKDFAGYSTPSIGTLLQARHDGTTLALAEKLWGVDFNGDGRGGAHFTDGGEEVVGTDLSERLDARGGDDKVFGGKGSDLILGGGGDDVLFGQSGYDTLLGGKGIDTLFGGEGNDTLVGGSGRDAFFFDTRLNGKTNVDHLADFRPDYDYIGLDSAVFTELRKGYLGKFAFQDIAKHDVEANDRVLYDSKSGDLFYDRDGSGDRYAAVKFAHLDNHAALTAHDFFVV